ncbi:RRM domain-containing protein [Entamoeba marina]
MEEEFTEASLPSLLLFDSPQVEFNSMVECFDPSLDIQLHQSLYRNPSCIHLCVANTENKILDPSLDERKHGLKPTENLQTKHELPAHFKYYNESQKIKQMIETLINLKTTKLEKSLKKSMKVSTSFGNTLQMKPSQTNPPIESLSRPTSETRRTSVLDDISSNKQSLLRQTIPRRSYFPANVGPLTTSTPLTQRQSFPPPMITGDDSVIIKNLTTKDILEIFKVVQTFGRVSVIEEYNDVGVEIKFFDKDATTKLLDASPVTIGGKQYQTMSKKVYLQSEYMKVHKPSLSVSESKPTLSVKLYEFVKSLWD